MPLVVLLRGVNIGGHNVTKPSALAVALERYDVKNIGAAGTFVVRGRVTRSKLRHEITRRIPFETIMHICSGREFSHMIRHHPFDRHPEDSATVRFVSFLHRKTRIHPRFPVRFPARGRWLVRVLAMNGRFVYGQYRRDMKVIRFIGSLDALFGAPLTSRSWGTILRIQRVLEQ